jgi:hypothetical protein
VGASPAAVRADVETAPVYLNDFAPKTLCLKCNIRSFLRKTGMAGSPTALCPCAP